ncbi:hypothetical protein [Acidaminococcus sp.]|uniref:hypothetical protein n=1 Tax=Acidaminococcus sp. TaxID=1872103 RepID=UPI003D7E4CDE
MSKITTVINARAALMDIGVEAEKISALAAEQYARLMGKDCDALDVTEKALYRLDKQLTALKGKRRDLVRARYEMRKEKREECDKK